MQPSDRSSFWRRDFPVAAFSAAFSIAVVAMEFIKRDDLVLSPFAAYPVAVLASATLLWRRRYPVHVALVSAGFAIALLAMNSHGSAAPVVIALYALSRYGHRWTAVATGGLVIAGAGLAVGLFGSWATAVSTTLWLTVWLEAGTIAGDIKRRNQLKIDEANARATAAEHNRDELARRHAAEERVRIARDLHDSLTHAISVVNVQSSVALHVLSRQPAQAEAALRNIREASRDAMRELRATLRALRIADSADAPGMDALAQLVERSRQSGQTVDLRVGESLGLLPAAVDRTVYRIVQEALTNVTRHSDASTIEISVSRDDTQLRVTVADDGTPIGDEIDEGLGLLGMRERVTALGGRLRVGFLAAGGFEVSAVLPIQEVAVEEMA